MHYTGAELPGSARKLSHEASEQPCQIPNLAICCDSGKAHVGKMGRPTWPLFSPLAHGETGVTAQIVAGAHSLRYPIAVLAVLANLFLGTPEIGCN